jgi:Flp pilus assembly protein TadG
MRHLGTSGAARERRWRATVEFAIVLPILLVVTLGIVQMGAIARDQQLVV